jgi:hypothetical protein
VQGKLHIFIRKLQNEQITHETLTEEVMANYRKRLLHIVLDAADWEPVLRFVSQFNECSSKAEQNVKQLTGIPPTVSDDTA